VRFTCFLTNPVGRLRIEIDLRRGTAVISSGPRPLATAACNTGTPFCVTLPDGPLLNRPGFGQSLHKTRGVTRQALLLDVKEALVDEFVDAEWA
jgi:hypothetical protein